MKYLVLFGLLSFALACGVANDEPPGADEGSPLVTGPGTVAASDGVSISYTVTGAGSPAMVFIHGWLCNQSFWSAQVEEFSKSYSVITIDLPGHGQSDLGREGWPMMAYGTDVQAVVDHLDLGQVVLIGHSMGGPVALEAARLMPDRVIGVVAVDSLHDADAKYNPEQMEDLLTAFEDDFVTTCGQFSASMFRVGSDPALVERVTGDMCDESPEVAIALMRQFVDYEMRPALAAVDVPVRYLNADGFPTNVEVNRRYQPNFDGQIMEGVGHFLMMEAPEAFNDLLKEVIESLDRPIE